MYPVSRRRGPVLYLFRHVLAGSAVFLVLMAIEVGIGFLWLLNVSQLSGNVISRFTVWVAASPHLLSVLFLALVDLVLVVFLIWKTAEPLAIRAYALTVRKEQERDSNLYTPLAALKNVYETPVNYQHTDPTIHIQKRNVHELVQQQDSHLLILGLTGAGKTTALLAYRYAALQRLQELVRGQDKIPIFIPMRDYNAFLKKINLAEAGQQQMLLNYLLYGSSLVGMHHLQPYLSKLAARGRLLFLCDGLNEVDSNYFEFICTELIQFMQQSQNRLIMTCRERDYREQRTSLQQLVKYADEALITPLEPQQIQDFVKRYIDNQSEEWNCSAEEVIQVIEHSRLRYHCTNPMMLYTLMKTINEIDVARGFELDTRGRLLREFVSQVIRHELDKPKWSQKGLVEDEVVVFLSLVACTARRAKYRNAIQLITTKPVTGSGGRRTLSPEELAQALLDWLENPDLSLGADDENDDDELEPIHEPYHRIEISRFLEFAQDAALISISQNAVLSFRHELIAEYFVAEYLYRFDTYHQLSSLPYGRDILQDIGAWSEPITLWAGLLPEPMKLAQRLADAAKNDDHFAYNALALSLASVGVVWSPPQGQTQRLITLPQSVIDLLARYVANQNARVKLAAIFKRCAEEGGMEVYRSLLPLLDVKGVNYLLLQINDPTIPRLLFEYLCEAINQHGYESKMSSLIQALGLFGEAAVPRASELSRPTQENNLRLRVAAIRILARTKSQQAVVPLVAYLGDPDQRMIAPVVNALIALGPELALDSVVMALGNQGPAPQTQIGQIHWSALAVLKGFLTGPSLLLTQYQRIIHTILLALSSGYALQAQQEARSLLIQQASTQQVGGNDRREYVIETLIHALSTEDEVMANNIAQVLIAIGQLATPSLVIALKESTEETVRVRIVEVLGAVKDRRALSHLLSLAADSSTKVQEKVSVALCQYAPASIHPLIELVLSPAESQFASYRAARILESIGQESVLPVTEALLSVVPGRTQLLVSMLANVHDSRAVPALIKLSEVAEQEAALAMPVIQALGQFPEERVAAPLLHMLGHTDSLISREAGKTLSDLGVVALDQLLAALDVEQETLLTPRVHDVLLAMYPFPAQDLLNAFKVCGEALALQIIQIFVQKQNDMAAFMVKNLFHEDERVRAYVLLTIDKMDGHATIQPLLEALNCTVAERPVVAGCLLKHGEAIPELVLLLADPERRNNASATLLDFGARVLPSMVHGLDQVDASARELAQDIIVTLVRRDEVTVPHVIRLFNPPVSHVPSLSERAYEGLLDVLTNHLADVSVPALLQAMESELLIEGVSDALKRLVPKSVVSLSTILDALYVEKKRPAAEMTLMKLGAVAADSVNKLITHDDSAVAESARRILRDMGAAAFPAIWASYSDNSDTVRQKAAIEILRGMRTEAIKDGLIKHLMSDNAIEVAMALSLLSRRIYDEAELADDKQQMIPALLEHAQKDNNHLRIIALLLLLTGDALSSTRLANLMLHFLYEHPEHHKDFVQAIPLLGNAAVEPLTQMLHRRGLNAKFNGEVASILGMITPHDEAIAYVRKLGNNDVRRTVPLRSEQRDMYLRAFGGLLASGNCDVSRLEELRRDTLSKPEREFYDVLLGQRRGPIIEELQKETEVLNELLRNRQTEVDTLDKRLKQTNVTLTDTKEENERLQNQNSDLKWQKEELAREVASLRRQLRG